MSGAAAVPGAHGPAVGSKHGITGSGRNDRFHSYYESGRQSLPGGRIGKIGNARIFMNSPAYAVPYELADDEEPIAPHLALYGPSDFKN